MSLRTKLLLSFLIPSVMWLAVGVWTSARMRNLGSTVEGMLADNERSILYAVEMVQALERMDSAILLRINGDSAVYAAIMDSASVAYRKSLALEATNITVPGERELLDTLQQLSGQYFSHLREVAGAPALSKYNLHLYPTFVATRRAISDLRTMNTEAMYSVAGQIADRARRAALPGDLLMLAAIIFTVAFTVLVQAYVIKPIRRLQNSVHLWWKSGKYEAAQIETNDELQELSEDLMRLCDTIRAKES